MTILMNRYFSFHGRLARMDFFISSVYASIALLILIVASIPLFSNGSRTLWWAGLGELTISVAIVGAAAVSLIVRRLHDLGLAGYHVIWVGAAQLGWTVLSYQSDYLLLAGLPFFAICLWLIFYPGNEGANGYD